MTSVRLSVRDLPKYFDNANTFVFFRAKKNKQARRYSRVWQRTTTRNKAVGQSSLDTPPVIACTLFALPLIIRSDTIA
eukprot:scaffold2917_cov191-Amphora_coffeaeformis.AAC.32